MASRIALTILITAFATHLLADEWYIGGDLHKSTLGQWSIADNANKLATAADWIVIVMGQDQVARMSKLEEKANAVVDCVDTLIPVIGESYDIEKENTNSTALLCITQLNENGWE